MRLVMPANLAEWVGLLWYKISDRYGLLVEVSMIVILYLLLQIIISNMDIAIASNM